MSNLRPVARCTAATLNAAFVYMHSVWLQRRTGAWELEGPEASSSLVKPATPRQCPQQRMPTDVLNPLRIIANAMMLLAVSVGCQT